MTLIIFCCLCGDTIVNRYKNAVLTKNMLYMCLKCIDGGNNSPPQFPCIYWGGIAKKKEKEPVKIIRYYC